MMSVVDVVKVSCFHNRIVQSSDPLANILVLSFLLVVGLQERERTAPVCCIMVAINVGLVGSEIS